MAFDVGELVLGNYASHDKDCKDQIQRGVPGGFITLWLFFHSSTELCMQMQTKDLLILLDIHLSLI